MASLEKATVNVALASWDGCDLGVQIEHKLICAGMNVLRINQTKHLSSLLKNAQVLIIPGGKCRIQSKSLKKQNGGHIIKNWLKAGGGLVTICSGSVVASSHKNGLSLTPVKLFNDNEWAQSGLSGIVSVETSTINGNYYDDNDDNVDIELPRSINGRGGGSGDNDSNYPNLIQNTNEFVYINGPLFDIESNNDKRRSNVSIIATFKSDVVTSRLNQVKTLTSSMDSEDMNWICLCCTCINDNTRSKCEFCQEIKTKKLPKENEMIGKGAIVSTCIGKGKAILFSFHPESSTSFSSSLQNKGSNNLFLENIPIEEQMRMLEQKRMLKEADDILIQAVQWTSQL